MQRFTVEPANNDLFRVIDHNDEKPVENEAHGVMEMPRELADKTAQVLNRLLGGPDHW